MTNVAIVVKEFPPDRVGGAETQTKRLATALSERGHGVTVFTKRYTTHDDSALPFEVVRVPAPRITPVFSDLAFVSLCLLLLVRRSREFDCLQCMMIHPVGVLGSLVHLLTGLPYFAWIRGDDFYAARHVPWKRLGIARVLADTLVLVQTESVREDVLREFPEIDADLRVLGNGVSIPEGRASGEDVLFVGRLDPKKDVGTLLAAMATVETDRTLVIVGDGRERGRLESLAETLGVPAVFEGQVPPQAVEDYYERAGIFVLPSVEGEGLPNVLLEAMARGLPVVATASGGVPSLIEDEKTGLLVPMRSPERLAESIQRLVDDDGLRTSMGNAAREHVECTYSWDAVVGELEEVYETVESGTG